MTEREIFIAAAQIESQTERAAFLDQACAGDLAMRERISGLLAEQDNLGSFLEVPPAAVATIDHELPANENTGTQVGPYKLLQKLGEGGMGAVWVAEQERPVKRRVALKLIKPGMDSVQVIARFEAERQALAMMDHSNIAKVLDAGTTENGRPFFVMELVKGVPITKYCDELNLPIRERLALFVPVCQAIQHAHQKGIIHRDLKPSNILVAMQDGRPVPKVIDFGVAKALHQPLTERTMMTEFGAVIGTLEYMSPEQAELSALDIDTRADIYALGVLLYELLTGSTPLDRKRLRSAALDEMLRIIREVEPPKPSTRLTTSENLASLAAHRRTEPRKLGAEIRGELDWIVMKALEKDRTRRYETASSFARDIDRFLSDEPVEACPPSTAYRFRKFIKKHFAALSTAAAFALVLVVASIVSAMQAIRAKRAEAQATIQRDAAADSAEQAKIARNQAVAERDRALTAEQLASERLQQVTTEKERAQRAETLAAGEAAIAKAVNEFLQNDLLGQADLYMQDRQALPPDRDVKLRTIVDRAAARVGGRFTAQPLVESALQLTIGQVYYSLGEYKAARQHLERALDLRQHELGADHLDTLSAANALATLCGWDAQFAQGEQLFQQVIAGRRKALGNEHPDTLTALWGLGELYHHSHKHAQMEPLVREVLAGRLKVLGEDHPDTLAVLLCAAMLHVNKRELDIAETKLLKVLESQRRVLGNEHPVTLMTEGNLGWVYMASKQHDKGVATLAQNLEKERKALGPDHLLTLGTQHNLAAAYWNVGKLDLAEQCYRESLERGRKTLGIENNLTQKNLDQLGRFYQEQGKHDQARELLGELLAYHQKSSPGGTGVAVASTHIALSLIRQEHRAEAEARLRESLVIFEQKAPTSWMRFHAQSLLGGLLLAQHKYADAEPLLLQGYEGLKLRQTLIPQRQRPRLTEAVDRLVQLYEQWGKKDEALLASVLHRPGKYQASADQVKIALDASRGSRTSDDILMVTSTRELATAYRASRNAEEIPLRQELLKAEQMRWGPDDPRTLTAKYDLSWAFWYGGKFADAENTFDQVHRQRAAKFGADHVDTLTAANGLAWSYQRLGRAPEAIELFERVRQRLSAKVAADHLTLQSNYNGLAQAYDADRQFAKAVDIRSKYLKLLRARNTTTDVSLAESLAAQGKSMLLAQRFADAEAVLRECLTLREKALPESWLTFYTKSSLGGALAGENKFAHAEPLLLAGYAGLRQREATIPANVRHARLIEALQRLIDLYTAWEKSEEAARWKTERESISRLTADEANKCD